MSKKIHEYDVQCGIICFCQQVDLQKDEYKNSKDRTYKSRLAHEITQWVISS
jgi:hypothetical protein